MPRNNRQKFLKNSARAGKHNKVRQPNRIDLTYLIEDKSHLVTENRKADYKYKHKKYDVKKADLIDWQ